MAASRLFCKRARPCVLLIIEYYMCAVWVWPLVVCHGHLSAFPIYLKGNPEDAFLYCYLWFGLKVLCLLPYYCLISLPELCVYHTTCKTYQKIRVWFFRSSSYVNIGRRRPLVFEMSGHCRTLYVWGYMVQEVVCYCCLRRLLHAHYIRPESGSQREIFPSAMKREIQITYKSLH